MHVKQNSVLADRKRDFKSASLLIEKLEDSSKSSGAKPSPCSHLDHFMIRRATDNHWHLVASVTGMGPISLGDWVGMPVYASIIDAAIKHGTSASRDMGMVLRVRSQIIASDPSLVTSHTEFTCEGAFVVVVEMISAFVSQNQLRETALSCNEFDRGPVSALDEDCLTQNRSDRLAVRDDVRIGLSICEFILSSRIYFGDADSFYVAVAQDWWVYARPADRQSLHATYCCNNIRGGGHIGLGVSVDRNAPQIQRMCSDKTLRTISSLSE